MKKFFTLIAAVAMAASVNAQDYVIQGGDAATYTAAGEGQSSITYAGTSYSKSAEISCTSAEGFIGYILKDGKSFANGGALTYNETEYTTIKLSNGAPTWFTIPNGVTISKVEIVGYSNDAETDSWISSLTNGTDEEVYTSDGAGECLPKGKGSSIGTITIDNLSLKGHFVIKNGGKQPCVIINLYKEGSPTAINSAVAEVESADADAPAYNLAGQKVGDNAKGIIIKNGKKYIRK